MQSTSMHWRMWTKMRMWWWIYPWSRWSLYPSRGMFRRWTMSTWWALQSMFEYLRRTLLLPKYSMWYSTWRNLSSICRKVKKSLKWKIRDSKASEIGYFKYPAYKPVKKPLKNPVEKLIGRKTLRIADQKGGPNWKLAVYRKIASQFSRSKIVSQNSQS